MDSRQGGHLGEQRQGWAITYGVLGVFVGLGTIGWYVSQIFFPFNWLKIPVNGSLAFFLGWYVILKPALTELRRQYSRPRRKS